MKKVLALVIALVLLCCGALAESASKTMIEVTVVETTTNLVIEAVVEQETQVEVLTAITEMVESGKPAVTYFPPEVQVKIVEQVKAQIAQSLEVSVEEISEEEIITELELVEFISLAVVEYDETIQEEVSVKLTCATVFEKEAQLVALLGLYDAAGEVQWELVNCTADEDGSVILQMTVAQVKAMDAAAAVTVAIFTK